MTDYQVLKSAAEALCTDFAAEKDFPNILSHFSTHESPIAIEYGLPCLAPFLGREFKGAVGVKQYFELISEQLSFREMEFVEYVVDTQQLKVSVKGKARFVWVSTGEAWNETFTYMLDFVKDDNGVLKIRRYQVWADTGAGEYLALPMAMNCFSVYANTRGRGILIAYLARDGKLKECLKNARSGFI